MIFSSFSRCRIYTYPSSFLIFRVQISLSVIIFSFNFLFEKVLNTITPSYKEKISFYSFCSGLSAYPFNLFSIYPLILITFPFFITFSGSLLRNYSFEGGLKALLSFDSKVFIPIYEDMLLYGSPTLSTTFRKTPFGYFPLRT